MSDKGGENFYEQISHIYKACFSYITGGFTFILDKIQHCCLNNDFRVIGYFFLVWVVTNNSDFVTSLSQFQH